MALNRVTTGYPKYDIPDSVVSRPNDDSGFTGFSGSTGLATSVSSSFSKIAYRISNNTSGISRARLYDYDADAFVITKDISASAGETVIFEYDFVSGQEYGIELDNNGSEWDVGLKSGSYPVSGDEIDIIARSTSGSQSSTSDFAAINDIGNPDNVLG